MKPRRRLSPMRIVALALLACWPLAWRYSSFGIDLEHPAGDSVECVFYRLRWPGDGSVCVARVVEHRAPEGRPLEPWDLGGAFLRPAPDLHPATTWQRLGFWCFDIAAGEPAPAIVAGADSAVIVGVPHWLLVVIALALCCRRRRTDASPTRTSAAP